MGRVVQIVEKNAGDYLARILEIEALSFPTPWSPTAFCDELRNPVSRFWGYEGGDRLWGYICYWFVGREIQILSLAVHPDRRRCGLGSLLMEQAIGTGAAEGAEGLWLEVRTSNQPAQRLYSGFGFREIGRRSRYYRDTGEDAIVMTLTIPAKRKRGSPAMKPLDSRLVSMPTHSSREV